MWMFYFIVLYVLFDESVILWYSLLHDFNLMLGSNLIKM